MSRVLKEYVECETGPFAERFCITDEGHYIIIGEDFYKIYNPKYKVLKTIVKFTIPYRYALCEPVLIDGVWAGNFTYWKILSDDEYSELVKEVDLKEAFDNLVNTI